MNNEKKYQVFISSTFIDLRKERQAAVEAILSIGHIPAGMELFAASDTSQWDVIKNWIDASDVYMLILGARYGTVNAETQLSYTHMEYEYALQAKKPLFAIVIKNEIINSLPHNFVEQDNKVALDNFRELVTSNTVSFYSDYKDIENGIFKSLNNIRQKYDLVGWVRGDQYDPGIAKELAKVSEEARKLREENQLLKEKQVQRTPNLSLLLNDNQALNLEYNINGVDYYSNPSFINDIPKHLVEYIDKQKVIEYNQILQDNTPEKIQEYNSMLEEVYAYENLAKTIPIKLSNQGNAIANNVEITITFPDFIRIFENINELENYKLNYIKKCETILKPLIENPIDAAKEKYNKEDFYKKRGFKSISAAKLLGLDLSRSSLSPINKFNIPIAPRVNTNSNIVIKDNIVKLSYTQLLHAKEINKSVIIVPLKAGEGIIRIIIHCEEYLEPRILELPMSVN